MQIKKIEKGIVFLDHVVYEECRDPFSGYISNESRVIQIQMDANLAGSLGAKLIDASVVARRQQSQESQNALAEKKKLRDQLNQEIMALEK